MAANEAKTETNSPRCLPIQATGESCAQKESRTRPPPWFSCVVRNPAIFIRRFGDPSETRPESQRLDLLEHPLQTPPAPRSLLRKTVEIFPRTELPRPEYGLLRTRLAVGADQHPFEQPCNTAATVLRLLGTPERAATGIMGWSNTAVARTHQHMTDRVRRDIAKRVDALIWGVPVAAGDDSEDGLIPA